MSTRISLRICNSSKISCVSAFGALSPATPACWMKCVVQDSILTFKRVICSIIFSGPIAPPSLHPVIANFLENVYIVNVLSYIPGRLAIDFGVPSYNVSKYASSEIKNMSLSITSLAKRSISSSGEDAPVGLL